jgi:hypothetical protein
VKKILASLLSLGLVMAMGLTLTGCGGGDTKKKDEKKADETKKT